MGICLTVYVYSAMYSAYTRMVKRSLAYNSNCVRYLYYIEADMILQVYKYCHCKYLHMDPVYEY